MPPHLWFQKEEMGEVLHEVDFNQLKIENQQYIEKIDERNQDLLRLKLMAGNTLQILNSYKANAMLIAVIYRSTIRPDNFGWICYGDVQVLLASLFFI